MESDIKTQLEIKVSSRRLFGKFATQQELDAEYDVEKAVANFEEYLMDFQKKSIKTRKTLNGRTSIFYGPTLMEKLTVYPAENPGAPVLVFIHGGYWRLGLGDDYDFVAMGPSQANFTVVVVTYALAPAVSIPEMVRQIRSSIAWTARNISDFNGNPDAIYIAGHSAGGHLAAMAIMTYWSDYGLPENIIKGGLIISGLYDLEPVSQSFVQSAVRITGEQILSMSPIRFVRPNNVPLTVAWGELETEAFRNQSSDYLLAWQRGGNQGNSLIVSGANHFNILQGFDSEDSIFTKALIALVDQNRP